MIHAPMNCCGRNVGCGHEPGCHAGPEYWNCLTCATLVHASEVDAHGVCTTCKPVAIDSPLEEARKLLSQWERFARTLADAGLIASPQRLLGKTVGFLDSTAC